jgi:hypothetical protein
MQPTPKVLPSPEYLHDQSVPVPVAFNWLAQLSVVVLFSILSVQVAIKKFPPHATIFLSSGLKST